MKPKAMISQPMRGYSPAEIEHARARAKASLEAKGYEVVDTYFREQWAEEDESKFPSCNGKRIWMLSKSIEQLAFCDAIYMCSDWEVYGGCQSEHYVALQYGLKIFYEDDEDNEEAQNEAQGDD